MQRENKKRTDSIFEKDEILYIWKENKKTGFLRDRMFVPMGSEWRRDGKIKKS